MDEYANVDQKNHPCKCIAYHLNQCCDYHQTHPRIEDCPYLHIIQSEEGDYGIPNFEASTSQRSPVKDTIRWFSDTYWPIDFCPWCGIKLSNKHTRLDSIKDNLAIVKT